MLRFLACFAFVGTGLTQNAMGAETKPTLSAYEDLNVETINVLPNGGEYDAYVLWSSDGRYIAVNSLGGDWHRIDLERATYGTADWVGHVIGYLKDGPQAEKLQGPKIAKMWAATRPGARSLTLENGAMVELRPAGFGTQFVVTRDGRETVRWATELDGCHSLTTAKGLNQVAFLCGSGVFISKVD